MESNKLISVIIPIYNSAEYLCACVDSVLAQTYGHFECILVDDGSVDASPEICSKYCNADKRVKYIRRDNGGQGAARNSGLDAAQGEFILFIDSDDRVEPELFETLYRDLCEYNADISCVRLYQNADKSDRLIDGTVTVRNNLEAIETFVQRKDGIDQCPVAKLFTRRIFDDIRFLEIRGFEDAGTIYKAFMRAEKVVSRNISLYYYYQREGSTMRRAFSELDYNRVVAYTAMEKDFAAVPEYSRATASVSAQRAGAVYYVAGEAIKRGYPEKYSELVQKCREDAAEMLCTSGKRLSKKNRVLLFLLKKSPKLFGAVYKRRYK